MVFDYKRLEYGKVIDVEKVKNWKYLGLSEKWVIDVKVFLYKVILWFKMICKLKLGN